MTTKNSKFLPNNFSNSPIALIAGKGDYPSIVAERIRSAQLPIRLISFVGETGQELISTFEDSKHCSLKVGQLGKLLKALDRLECKYAIMAGQITPKKLFHGLKLDLKMLRLLGSLKLKNAETIFGSITKEIEALNIQILDARAFLDQDLAAEGVMTSNPLQAPIESIEHGIHVAKTIANMDIGQGCVVRNGTVIAVEAYEGTNSMLRRAGTFKTDGLVFIKAVKKNQDFRFDVPVFGIKTLEVMQEAGIQTAALEQGKVILLDKKTILKKAKKLKIEIYGFNSID